MNKEKLKQRMKKILLMLMTIVIVLTGTITSYADVNSLIVTSSSRWTSSYYRSDAKLIGISPSFGTVLGAWCIDATENIEGGMGGSSIKAITVFRKYDPTITVEESKLIEDTLSLIAYYGYIEKYGNDMPINTTSWLGSSQQEDAYHLTQSLIYSYLYDQGVAGADCYVYANSGKYSTLAGQTAWRNNVMSKVNNYLKAPSFNAESLNVSKGGTFEIKDNNDTLKDLDVYSTTKGLVTEIKGDTLSITVPLDYPHDKGVIGLEKTTVIDKPSANFVISRNGGQAVSTLIFGDPKVYDISLTIGEDPIEILKVGTYEDGGEIYEEPMNNVKFEVVAAEDIYNEKKELVHRKGDVVDTIITDDLGEGVSSLLYQGLYEIHEVEYLDKEDYTKYSLPQDPVVGVIDLMGEDVIDQLKIENKAIQGFINIHLIGHRTKNLIPLTEDVDDVKFDIVASEDIFSPKGEKRYKKGDVVYTGYTDDEGKVKSPVLLQGQYEVHIRDFYIDEIVLDLTDENIKEIANSVRSVNFDVADYLTGATITKQGDYFFRNGEYILERELMLALEEIETRLDDSQKQVRYVKEYAPIYIEKENSLVEVVDLSAPEEYDALITNIVKNVEEEVFAKVGSVKFYFNEPSIEHISTGDNANNSMYIALAIMSLLAVTSTVIIIKKKSYK